MSSSSLIYTSNDTRQVTRLLGLMRAGEGSSYRIDLMTRSYEHVGVELLLGSTGCHALNAISSLAILCLPYVHTVPPHIPTRTHRCLLGQGTGGLPGLRLWHRRDLLVRALVPIGGGLHGGVDSWVWFPGT